MKENLLGKSVTEEEQPSLQSQRYSYPSTGRVSNYTQTSRKVRKVPTKKIVETLRDESYGLQMQNYGILRKIVKLYQRFPVLNPEGTAMLFWNIANFTIIIFYLFEIGLLIGFGQPFWNDQVTYFYAGNMIFVVFFILDILISPLKAYYQNGILVTSRISIFKRYYQLYIWLDLIALVSIIAPYISLSLTTNYFKLLFASKLLNAYELDKYLLMYMQNKFKRSHMYGLSRLVLLVILWSHWFAIGFFTLDYWVYTTNYYGPNTPSYCWIYNSPLNMNISDTYWYIQYLYSIYFSIGNITTIAYGDVVPRNPIQCVYIIFAMTFAIMLFTYFFKEMIQLIFESNAEEIDNKQSFSVIKRFLINNKVPGTLATKIKSYFQTNWLHQQLKNKQIQEELIQKLPKELKIQLHFAYYSSFITQLGIIPPGVDISSHITHSPFLCELSAAIQAQKVMAGQLLYSQGEAFQQHQYVFYTCKQEGQLTVTLGLGVINWPHAELFLQQHKSDEDLYLLYGKNIVIKNLTGMFGQESFFLQCERTHWAVSNRHMELHKLSRSKFSDLLIKFGGKTQKQQVCLTIENIKSRYCFICKQFGHIFSKCSYVTYVPHQQQLLEQLKSQNIRTNNQMITQHRESWVNFTTKQNSWKLYLELKSSRKKHVSKYQQQLRQQQEDKDKHINQNLFEELAVLHTLLKQHINKQIQTKDHYRQGLNVDEGVSYSVYKPKFNIQEELKKYNFYTYKSKKKKVKD